MKDIYRLPVGTPMTPDLIDKYIRYFGPEQARRERLQAYYESKHDILDRRFSDETKPNNRVVSPFARNITDFSTGYFAGTPIRYENTNEAVDYILKYNDDPAVVTELAKNCSIYGHAYELLYTDIDGELRYVSINPTECFMIYDTTLDTEPLYFIRYYKQHNVAESKDYYFAEVYDRYTVSKYCKTSGYYELYEQYLHNFGMVPATEYWNNPDGLGDFEPCISLIDAYDIAVSNSVNDSTEFSDAYLVISGAMVESDDVSEMKKKRVLCMDTDASVNWLTKDINSTFAEDLKNRLANSIHKFSNVPDMTDQNFAANASGVAMKYKLLGLESITAKKEGEFRKGLTRRFELFSAYLKLIGSELNWREVVCVFTRNLPVNLSEAGDAIQKFGHLLSKETQLSLLPIDIDIDGEMEKIAEEKAAGYDDGWLTSTMPLNRV